MVKNPPANVGSTRDTGLIPGSGRSPGVGNGNLLQYSCLENSMDRRSLVAYNPWGPKESEVSKHTHTQGKETAEESEGASAPKVTTATTKSKPNSFLTQTPTLTG